MRLQVFLSHSGACSRRKALDLVKQGCVMVNEQMVCEPSYEVNPEKDRVFLQGVPIEVKRHEYIMLNKPPGVTTTKKDRFAKKTVMDLLPKEFQHLYPVGRLDRESQGLLILTNNGQLANSLMHPRFEVEKVYAAEVKGRLKENDRVRLQQGIILEGPLAGPNAGRRTAPCRIDNIEYKKDTTVFEISVHEGRKRQIRLMLLGQGYPVLFLKRIKEGPLGLGDLPEGKWRRLNEAEIKSLQSLSAVKHL
jgi:23S rRNA pseudouridine2605 synthase